MTFKKIGPLHYSELNQEFLEILEPMHKSVLSVIVTCCGHEYYYKKAMNEVLWYFDLEVLNDMIVFFGLQEMFQFVWFIEKVIEVKTLECVCRILNIQIF